MNEVLKKWIEALRSGKYVQGRGYLHKERGGSHEYCCLGVLCELAVKEGVIAKPTQKTDKEFEDGKARKVSYFVYDNNLSILPGHVKNWVDLGMDFNAGLLIRMNDSESDSHKSFEGIADYLEDTYGGTE